MTGIGRTTGLAVFDCIRGPARLAEPCPRDRAAPGASGILGAEYVPDAPAAALGLGHWAAVPARPSWGGIVTSREPLRGGEASSAG